MLCLSASACTTRSEKRWGLSGILPNPSHCSAAAGFLFLCLSSQLPAPLWSLLLLSGAGARQRWACWDLQQHQGVASDTHPSNLVLPAGGSGSSEERWGLRCSAPQAEPPRGTAEGLGHEPTWEGVVCGLLRPSEVSEPGERGVRDAVGWHGHAGQLF